MQSQGGSSAVAELQHLLTIPPSSSSNGNAARHDPTSVALAALQALRDSGDDRFLFLRSILEMTQQHPALFDEGLLFHCITCCRHVMLHKWTTWNVVFRDCVRDYFMASGLGLSQSQSLSQNTTAGSTSTCLSRTIQLACCTAAVAFWKRQWNDDANANDAAVNNTPQPRPEEEALVHQMKQQLPTMVLLSTKQDLFYYLESLLLQPTTNHSQQQQQQVATAAVAAAAACTFMSILIGEFSGKSVAVQYQMPLEFHKRVHESFEKDGWLDSCLHLSMKALGASHIVVVNSSGSSSTSSSLQHSNLDESVTVPVVQLTIDVIGWESGKDIWDGGTMRTSISSSTKSLVRPPKSWKESLIRPDFVGAIFHAYERVRTTTTHATTKLAHSLRQLITLLASLSGPVFSDETERKAYATYLLDGSIKLLEASASNQTTTTDLEELIDVLSLISRIIVNFKLSTLVELPSSARLLSAMASTGASLLEANVAECQTVRGDVDCMENGESREEAISILLDAVVLLCGDPWLLYSDNDESRKAAQHLLSRGLGPLYKAFVVYRIRMAKLEEHFLATEASDLDEVREEISSTGLEEELASVAVLGRLVLGDAMSCLSSLFHACVPNLQSLWNSQETHISPEGAACLEEIRLLIRCLGHLLTDDNTGETPSIPDAVVMSCLGNDDVTNGIVSSVQTVMSLAELQASKIAQNPTDPKLSPFLATSILWFLKRWAPAYIYPVDYRNCTEEALPGKILLVWTDVSSAQQAISFCATLCLHYQCYWPQERQVQEGAQSLLLALAKRGSQFRDSLVASPSFTQMVMCHCLTAGIRHNAPVSDLETTLQAKASGSVSLDMVRGYQRLRYDDRSNILTAILVATADSQNDKATAMLKESLIAVHSALMSLVHALSSKQIKPDDVNAQEMACLCVEMYGGVARGAEMREPERIIQFITPSLPHLSGLMSYYADVLTVCEGLLRLFRDYTEHFVALLDREQSVALFTASAELLKSYSSHHCASRVVVKRPTTTSSSWVEDAEEEQSYSDVLTVIQLLIHLSTKDFIDLGNANSADSNQVTDVVFFGLQQILPLMTQGLLQFPTLCTQYFSLVGFMMDTYPDKVCGLPYELFHALLESLLFGMSHMDEFVGRISLRGIASIVKEHLKTRAAALSPHLSRQPDLLDICTRRMLQEVVFQAIVWDRLESCGMAILPLAAVDPQRFVAVVNDLTQQVPAEQRVRLQAAFEKLMNVEVLTKVISSGGYEGRMNRVRFKKDFEVFVREVHSFLVFK